ncbi:MAG: dTDP-4-amino-4,6-dideoxygalactose transaminase [Bacteroidia bacterium]|jgi:dTDP-4-amino-4,6-dideoxygalactose transaminase
MKIPFNKPLVLGTEIENVKATVESGSLAANGEFSAKCHQYLEKELHFRKALLTTSCTSALELAALLVDIRPGDEVIVPSYAFVTTANAFATKGAKIVFCDSKKDHPNIDETLIEELITPNTKAIVALHYGGVPCNMDAIVSLASKHGIKVIEDNAQGIGSTYNGKPLGGIGDLGAISFQETKNVHCGEGGALLVNGEGFAKRAPVVWEMGTNKADYRNGKVSSYGWVDVGSSFYPSELNAAYLYSQLNHLGEVTSQRMEIWKRYYDSLADLSTKGHFELPIIPKGITHNAHTFYLTTDSQLKRDALIKVLASKRVSAAFHFQSLHKSAYFTDKHDRRELTNSDRFSNCLVRLPLYHSLTLKEQQYVITEVINHFEN